MTSDGRGGTALLAMIALVAGMGLGITLSNLLMGEMQSASPEVSGDSNFSFQAMIPLADGKAIILADGPFNTYWYYLVDAEGKATTIYPYGGDQSPLAISR